MRGETIGLVEIAPGSTITACRLSRGKGPARSGARAIRVDHIREAQYLDALAGALDLSPEMRETVHRPMGVT